MLAFAIMGVASAIVVSLLIGNIAYSLGRDAIEAKVSDNLQSQRQIKKAEIENYIDQLRMLLVSQAQSGWLKEAAVGFSGSFSERVEFELDDDFSGLQQYYQQEFSQKYEQANGAPPNLEVIWNGLSRSAKVLQKSYISDNSHPLGGKDALNFSVDATRYDRVHQKYHSTLRGLLNAFELYDVFIVEPTEGVVVYSTYKELDFATSLSAGPYQGSGLAEAYRRGKNLSDGENVLIDFASYEPSYKAAAAFISTPIYSDADLVGVLVFQMPLDRINRLMTYSGQWQQSGLGDSGETYILGGDQLLRSASRFQTEDPSGFAQALKRSGVEGELVDYFERGGSAIGKLAIDTEAARMALEGNQGVVTQQDYRGEWVVSAFGPLDIAGVDWAILSEQDVAEAFAAVEALKGEVVFWASLICALSALIATAVGWVIARGIALPIEAISNSVQEISSEQNLTSEVPELGDHELRSLAGAINTLIQRLRVNVSAIQDTAEGVRRSAVSLNDSMSEVMAAISDQNDRCHQQASAATQMEQTVQEVAKNAALTAEKTGSAAEIADSTDGLIASSVSGFNELSSEISGVTETVESVDRGTKEIGGVLDVIRGIAEQTNLLALNAAIEAARAGETGRGFAVVADEVRTLASRTAEATTEINEMINRLQSGSQSAVHSMAGGSNNLAVNLDLVGKIQESVTAEAKIISDIAEMNIQVATAAEQQAAVAVEISRNASLIHESASSTSERVLGLSEMSRELSGLSDDLREIVDSYQV